MMKRPLILSALTTALFLSTGSVLAADQPPAQGMTMQKKEPIYGSQLMTRQERTRYRAKLRTAKTAEERDQIRKEHHELMKQRAKERGITLPDEMPARKGGMGPGSGMPAQGSGMKSGESGGTPPQGNGMKSGGGGGY